LKMGGGYDYLDLVRSVVDMLSLDEDTIEEILEGARVRDEVPFTIMMARRAVENLIEDVEDSSAELKSPKALEVINGLVTGLRKVLEKFEECPGSSEKCYSDNELDVECVDCHYQVLREAYKLINRAKEDLLDVTHDLNRGLKKRSGAGALLKSKADDYRGSLDDIKRISRLMDRLNNAETELEAMYAVLNTAYHPLATSDVDDRAVFILKLLLELSSSGAYVGDILSALTGLRSVTADPVDKEVTIYLPSKDERRGYEEHTLPLQTLFYRYPPFEPISLEDKNGVSGSHVWFVKIKNMAFSKHGPKMYIHPDPPWGLGFNPKEPIHKAYLSDAYELVKAIYPEHIFSINPVNVLKARDGHVIIAVSLNKKERVYIKYGSKFLKEHLHLVKKGDDLRELYVEELGRKGHRGRVYEPTDLTYAWYCTAGYGLSTDPLDVKCPFVKLCQYGKECGGRKWKWARRIFPKVFLDVERSYAGVKETRGLISPVVRRNVLIKEDYPSAHLSMPESGLPVVFRFSYPFSRSLPKTNVVGFRISPEFLELVVRTVIDENALKSPELARVLRYELWKDGPKVRLADVLLSKFFIYDNSGGGFRTYDLLGRTTESLLGLYRLTRNDVLSPTPEGERHLRRFIGWASRTILHSLAHAFMSYVSVELQIEPDNLVYLYDEKEGLVLVAENSPIGAIDLIGALEEWGRSRKVEGDVPRRFIEEFLRREFEFLRRHEEDTVQYSNRVTSVVSALSRENDLKDLREAILRLYNELLKEGLVLDVHSLSTHLLLAPGGQTNLERLIAKNGLDVDVQKAHRYFDDVLLTAVPNYCVDGCTTCVVMDRGCTEGLGQTYTVSRKLMEFTIGVLLEEYPLRGPGGSYLRKLLSMATESVDAMSPYLDEKGVELLKELAGRGIRVRLSTRPEFVQKYGEELRKAGVEVLEVREDHDKWYCIDGEVLIKPTANMNLWSENYNSFRIMLGRCRE